MSSYYFILNPLSGKGKASHIISRLLNSFTRNDQKPIISSTKKAGEATLLARDAVRQGYTHIIAIGGDGTVNEIVNGIADSHCTLGVIPMGSGNDFARTLYSGSISIDAVLKTLAQNKQTPIDVGWVRSTNKEGETKEKYFINGIGIGLDAKVAYEAKKLNWLPNNMIYTMAALKTIMTYDSTTVSIYNNEMIDSEKKYLLISVGNGKSAGGGFYLTPDADLADGVYDICLVKDITLLKILKIFPTVFKGKHGKFPEVKFLRTNELRIQSAEGLPVHIDGEILGLQEADIEIKLKHNALNVIVP